MSNLPVRFNNKTALPMRTQVLGDNLLPSIKKKSNLHTKNPYRSKKKNPFKKIVRPERILDGFYLLEKSQCEFPHEVVLARLSNKNLIDAVESDLAYFENLTRIDLSENSIQDIRKLSALKALNRLDLQHNGIEDINFTESDALENLQELDFAYNKIRFSTLPNLQVHPKIRILNLMGNELSELPDDMSWFESLEILNLSSNHFESNQKAQLLWGALASIPHLKDLDISRNSLRGIHTEKLIPGSFNELERLDFSYNKSENQHNLICTRNFKSLKILIVTGNPFAFLGQHKGLEKEIYMRVGAVLINDSVDIPYLKKQKKSKPPIKFTNLWTIQPDDIKKEAKNTFFGVELPPEEMDIPEDREAPAEAEESEGEDEDQAKFFITEDEKKLKRKTKKKEMNINEYDDENQDNREYDENDNQEIEEGKNEYYEEEGQREQSSEQNQGSNDRDVEIDLDNIGNLDDFKKIANMLIGDSKDYEQPLEINTAYKLLRQAVKKNYGSDKTLDSYLSKSQSKNSKGFIANNKSKHNTVQARMLDVEFLIDELNKKMTASNLNS